MSKSAEQHGNDSVAFTHASRVTGQSQTDTADISTTALAEQSQNPGQAGKASTSISKDYGGNDASGEDLDRRLDQADFGSTREIGKTSTEERGMVVGADQDIHNMAAAKQP